MKQTTPSTVTINGPELDWPCVKCGRPSNVYEICLLCVAAIKPKGSKE